ncbi:zinc-ribbon domain-containing protein [Lachnospiraceae bacterium ASD3451]|uniref:zinc-ribbon domain-containing protein n=1 Tax=Diplocloster agilis TaxID=2850323 RepID=UPI001DEBEDF5|nr:zinc-ribbon domain-containing protein [Diplocloster agilis]MBU9746958.1 zinc-ribbon domain-containing protein [Diplocloster agilis]
MIYCRNCGCQNDENSRYCVKCGAALYDNISPKNGNDNNNKSKSLFAAHLINILAVAIPAALLIAVNLFMGSSGDSSEGNITFSIDADLSEAYINIAAIIGLAVFIIGLIIYFIKQQKAKMLLSIIYISVAVCDFVFLIATWSFYVLMTCGLGAVMYVPGILQIIAGILFLIGSKSYAAR